LSNEDVLKRLYDQYKVRVLKVHKILPIDYKEYCGLASKDIGRYVELRQKAVNAIQSKILPSAEKEDRENEERANIYLIYSEIIDLVEKG